MVGFVNLKLKSLVICHLKKKRESSCQNVHAFSLFVITKRNALSVDPAWSSSTLLRPTTPKTTTTAWMFLATTKKFILRSGLFVIDSSKANNPKNDDYCLNENSNFGSGDPDCSSSTLTRPTTPKATTTRTTWTSSSTLLRPTTPKTTTMATTKKFVSFPGIRPVHCRLFWGQQPQKRLLRPWLSERPAMLLISGDPDCLLSTPSRPTTPKATITATTKVWKVNVAINHFLRASNAY